MNLHTLWVFFQASLKGEGNFFTTLISGYFCFDRACAFMLGR